MRIVNTSIVIIVTLVAYSMARGDEPPSYAKRVQPFFARYCVECHNDDDLKGGLSLESFTGLSEGADTGPIVVPGKPEESAIVLVVESKRKPKMPPAKAKQPKPDEIGLLRAWVAAGAKDDSAALPPGARNLPTVPIPDIKPTKPAATEVTAIAYSRDGKLLAAAGHQEVLLVHTADAQLAGKLAGLPGGVTALDTSADGKFLAVATGLPAQAGEIWIYPAPTPPVPTNPQPVIKIQAHADVIHNLRFSPDGRTIASASYDRLVKVWDLVRGAELKTLKDHSDAVYDIAWSPDAKLLASVAADRAVKVWDVVAGKRLFTLSEPTDWVYAVAWHPAGKWVAAAGVDRSIRVWEVSPAGGKVVHSTFAHNAPIIRLAYSADGKILYSLSEDGTAKAWDAATMVERHVFERQSETALALGLSPDGTKLALGRYNGSVTVYAAADGKRLQDPLPLVVKPAPKPEPPLLTAVSPRGAERGKTVRLALDGKHLDAAALRFSVPGLTARRVESDAARQANQAWFDVTIPADAPPGVYRVQVKTPGGESSELAFVVGRFPEVAEVGATDSQLSAQPVTLPTTISGCIDRAGDTDYFQFEAAAGQQLGVEVVAGALGSKLEPVLSLIDRMGHVVAESPGGSLGHSFDQAGSYSLRIRDVDYRGSAEMFYRVSLGEIPVISDVFPLGLARGSTAEIQVRGVHLGNVRAVQVQAPADAAPGTRIDVPVTLPAGAQPLGARSVVVGEYAELLEGGDNDPPGSAHFVPTPATVNGRIEKPGDVDCFRFVARKGQPLILDIDARRLGSPLDSMLEILDARGQPLPRATLRTLAKTYVTFRDHDSRAPGIRIEDWRELAMNDYVRIGNELLRIDQLPKNPDDDCRFFELRGQRMGMLDTTPTHQPQGTPIYKVSLHPPGSTFPPNGMPVFTVPYENDDGGPQYGKDSRLFFDAPGDAEYIARVSDVRGQGGPGHAYRLAIRPPKPSFTISRSPETLKVWKGGSIPLNLSCERFDGFDGAIDVEIAGLPAGFSAPRTTIPAGENSTALALFAEANAMATDAGKASPVHLVARATIGGKPFVRELPLARPEPVDAGDILTTLGAHEVTVSPGGIATLSVTVERRGGFKGRIPIDVRGLPRGVRVLDIGLNGILITERESQRTMQIYCEPWVQPTSHPFVVFARREGKNTEHGAKSVLLKVAAGHPAAAGQAAPTP
jgi:WD40 repeat protein